MHATVLRQHVLHAELQRACGPWPLHHDEPRRQALHHNCHTTHFLTASQNVTPLTSWLLVQAGQESGRHPPPRRASDGGQTQQPQTPASPHPAPPLTPAFPQTTSQTHPPGCLQFVGLPNPDGCKTLGLLSLSGPWQLLGRVRWWVVVAAGWGC